MIDPDVERMRTNYNTCKRFDRLPAGMLVPEFLALVAAEGLPA